MTVTGAPDYQQPFGSELQHLEHHRAMEALLALLADGVTVSEDGAVTIGDGESEVALVLSIASTAITLPIQVQTENGLTFAVSKVGRLQTSGTQAATGPVGTVVGKYRILDEGGVTLGYLPIYDTIT